MELMQMELLYRGNGLSLHQCQVWMRGFKHCLAVLGVKLYWNQRVCKNKLKAVQAGLERVKGMVRSNQNCSLISLR